MTPQGPPIPERLLLRARALAKKLREKAEFDALAITSKEVVLMALFRGLEALEQEHGVPYGNREP